MWVLSGWHPCVCCALPSSCACRQAVLTLAYRLRQGRAAPQGVGGLKLILAGRLLDNSVTLADARCPTADLVTMHLVMTPPKVRRHKPRRPCLT